MRFEIVKVGKSIEEPLYGGECESYDDALEEFVDCVLDNCSGDSWLMEDYMRIKEGKNAIKLKKMLDQLKKSGEVYEYCFTVGFDDNLVPTSKDECNLVLRVEKDDDGSWDELGLYKESWDPKYDDYPTNQWGEKWQSITDTYIGVFLEKTMQDVQIDPFEDGPRMESLSLGSLHICEDGHLIATIYGGANGGGFRGVESNWPFYLSLVRKFLGKLMDMRNRDFIKDVWLIDWDNDCCDDVWTLRLGLELADKEKKHLIECGKRFSVVDPTKLNIDLDTAVEMATPIQAANVVATVAESRKRK